MTICCVTVTYANRYHLLSEVVHRLLSLAVSRIVIVDNGCLPESRAAIARLQEQHPGTILVKRLEQNEGSARGFAVGIAAALDTVPDFIWILDDDNKPRPAALQALRACWNGIERKDKNRFVALSSYRNDRPNFTAALREDNPDLILPPRNNFAGFHVRQIFTHLAARLAGHRRTIQELPSQGRISAAAYGGLFFHRDLLLETGLPDERYFLYYDDFALTYPLTGKGGEIWLVTNSVLEDIEASFYLSSRKKLLYHSLLDGPRPSNVYYIFRNTIYFSRRYLTGSPAVYYFNKYIFIALIAALALLKGKTGRLALLKDAVFDGENGRMGKNDKYPV